MKSQTKETLKSLQILQKSLALKTLLKNYLIQKRNLPHLSNLVSVPGSWLSCLGWEFLNQVQFRDIAFLQSCLVGTVLAWPRLDRGKPSHLPFLSYKLSPLTHMVSTPWF